MTGIKSTIPYAQDVAGLTAKQPSSVGRNMEKSQADKVATEFEALLVKQMFKSMWESVPKTEGGLSGSREEELYRDMFNDAIAKDMSENQSLGIRDVVLRELTKK